MSYDALDWAWQQPGLSSSERLMLLYYADLVDHRDECFPSARTAAAVTGLDRKTVLACTRRLIERGFVIDTGRRRGGSNAHRQVRVLRLVNVPHPSTRRRKTGTKIGTTENGTGTKSGTPTGTENGTATGTKNGTENKPGNKPWITRAPARLSGGRAGARNVNANFNRESPGSADTEAARATGAAAIARALHVLKEPSDA